MEFADLFGYAGTVTGSSFMIPQVWKSWRTQSVEDISWLMLGLFFLNSIFWFMYGFFLGSIPLMLSNGIVSVVVLTQVSLKILYRK